MKEKNFSPYASFGFEKITAPKPQTSKMKAKTSSPSRDCSGKEKKR